MNYPFVTLDVFTEEVFGGNPLAVVLDARGLTGAQMQNIAREFNLSETTFVLPPANQENTHRVRIFTPVAELPFAGHPTLGTAIALAERAGLPKQGFRFEEGVGVVTISVSMSEGRASHAELSVAQLPEHLPDTLSVDTWASLLGLEPSELCPGDSQVGTWTCGAPFSFVPVTNLAALSRASVTLADWQQHLSGSQSNGAFVFTRETDDESIDVRARMFAPAHGIAEDPATGSAVAALAGWLIESEKSADGTHVWTISQGIEMGRPSHLSLKVDVKKGRIASVRFGGCAVPVSAGAITLS